MKIFSFLKYYLIAKNEHAIHAPFLYNLYCYLKNDCLVDFNHIETIRNQLLSNDTIIDLDEIGKGSKVLHTKKRKISSIAKTSLSTQKYSILHHKLIQYFKPKTIVELGTSFGINTLYLANANPDAVVYTFEGSKKIAEIAKNNFIARKNITLIEGDFDVTLEKTLNHFAEKVDYVFIDGNHALEPTLHYFELILHFSNENTIFIFDDIHWSDEMEMAWKQIKMHTNVTLSVDLLYLGIVFVSKKLSKQHFVLKY